MKNKINTILFSGIILVLFALCLFMPKAEYSDTERRALKKMPTLSVSSIFSGDFMKNFEDYTLDSFPFRDSFRTIKALTSKYFFSKKDNNGLYTDTDGYISKKEYPLREKSIENAAKKFEDIYTKHFKDKDFGTYLSIIPDKNYFMDGDKLTFDYDEFVKSFTEKTEFLEYIDIFPLLSKEDYYKTDTHWKQENIVDVAEKLASSMGTSLETDYKENTLDKDFYGVFYGQAALPGESGKITYLTNSHTENAVVYDFQNGKEISVYDFEKGNGKDPYELYLSGPLSLITVENEKATSDKELILFRDSFTSSLAPLLISGYKKIILVDIRYTSLQMLSKFVEFKEGSDVLFIYSTLVLNNSEEFK